MRDPVTPGGFNASMAWRPASSSATADDMVDEEDEEVEEVRSSSKVEVRESRMWPGRVQIGSVSLRQSEYVVRRITV